MLDGSWIKCNKCFCDLEVVKYPEGIYINPCSCMGEKDFQEGFYEGYDSGKEDGYSEGEADGYKEGKSDGEELGYYNGFREGMVEK